MKLFYASLISFTILSISSCSKVKEALNLSTDVTLTPKSAEFSIPAQATTDAEVTFKEIQAEVNLDSLIKTAAPDFDKTNIKSVKIKGFKIEFLNGDDANNFANFKSINSQLEASGKSPIVIVSTDNNPDEKKTSLTIPANETIELKDYISSGIFKYVFKGKLRRATTKALTTKVTVDYTFKVNLQ